MPPTLRDARADRLREGPIFYWDDEALDMVSGIENSIVPLDLDSQGQFIALTNAIEMQLESGAPVHAVVRLLGDALLALANARRLPSPTQVDLVERVSLLNQRVHRTSPVADSER